MDVGTRATCYLPRAGGPNLAPRALLNSGLRTRSGSRGPPARSRACSRGRRLLILPSCRTPTRLCRQLYLNFKLGRAEGLSLLFLADWLLGDITNLIGCILTKQVSALAANRFVEPIAHCTILPHIPGDVKKGVH